MFNDNENSKRDQIENERKKYIALNFYEANLEIEEEADRFVFKLVESPFNKARIINPYWSMYDNKQMEWMMRLPLDTLLMLQILKKDIAYDYDKLTEQANDIAKQVEKAGGSMWDYRRNEIFIRIHDYARFEKIYPPSPDKMLDLIDSDAMDLMEKLDTKFVDANVVDNKLDVMSLEYHFDRPVLGKLLVLPEKTAKKFTYDKPWACISIVSCDSNVDNRNEAILTKGTHPELSAENRTGLLQLVFDDIRWEVSQSECRVPLFNEEMAKQIVCFVKDNWAKVDLLMIHCWAGLSRSAGVAKAISDVYQEPKFSGIISRLYHPNPRVYDTLTNVFTQM